MKKITILTLFPKVFDDYFNTSIIKRALNNSVVQIDVVNFRDFADGKHKVVDDTPYGGGPGMVLKIEPIVKAINHYKTSSSKIILLTPSGQKYSQKLAKFFSIPDHLILICGHYEGFDERILNYVDAEISIGDYILSGGELPAMVLVDSIIRMYDGAIKKESIMNESFENNLLDYPVYTKPVLFDGYSVPDVLLSGNHKLIDDYRLNAQIEKTRKNRIDLFLKSKYKNMNRRD